MGKSGGCLFHPLNVDYDDGDELTLVKITIVHVARLRSLNNSRRKSVLGKYPGLFAQIHEKLKHQQGERLSSFNARDWHIRRKFCYTIMNPVDQSLVL